MHKLPRNASSISCGSVIGSKDRGEGVDKAALVWDTNPRSIIICIFG